MSQSPVFQFEIHGQLLAIESMALALEEETKEKWEGHRTEETRGLWDFEAMPFSF